MGLIMSTYVKYFQSKEKHYNTLVVEPIVCIQNYSFLYVGNQRSDMNATPIGVYSREQNTEPSLV